MKKRKVSIKELVGYIISGVIALFGLALMITHTVGAYSHGLNRENAVIIAEKKLALSLNINLDFLGWGIIFLVLGAFIALMILLSVAKKVDVEVEKEQRRKQRLGL